MCGHGTDAGHGHGKELHLATNVDATLLALVGVLVLDEGDLVFNNQLLLLLMMMTMMVGCAQKNDPRSTVLTFLVDLVLYHPPFPRERSEFFVPPPRIFYMVRKVPS
jgi:hypothetical protein